MILHKIADETHSKVYTLSTRKHEQEIVRAIKFQNQFVQFPQIVKQVTILKKVFASNQFQIGFPRMYQYGNDEGQNYMITRLLGPNIAQLHKLCNSRFSQRTCLLVGLQILDRIQKIHELGYVYRDIRLQNFVIGLGSQSNYIFMIDFGGCQKYRNRQTNNHIPYKQGNLNIQDYTFMSINVHNNVHYSRRDDIQSILYLIIYMLKGRLPWRKVDAKTKKQKDEKIGDFKKAVSASYLAKDFGIQMADLLWYIRSVNYYQKPDYEFIRSKLLSMIMAKSQSKGTIEIKYDWNQRQDMDYTIYNGQPKLHLNKEQPVQRQEDQDQEEKDKQSICQNVQEEELV